MNKTLPIGVLSKSQKFASLIAIILGIAIGVGFLCVWEFVLGLNFWAGVGIFFGFYFICYFTMYICTNKALWLTKRVLKTADFNTFNSELDKVINNNLHEETKNWISIIKTECYFFTDMNEAVRLYLTLNTPTYKPYWIQYQVLSVEYYLLLDSVDLAKERLELIKTNKKIYDRISLRVKALEVKEDILNVEDVFNYNTSKRMINMGNIYFLFLYYSKRNNPKAKDIADIILKDYTDMPEMCRDVTKYIEENN